MYCKQKRFSMPWRKINTFKTIILDVSELCFLITDFHFKQLNKKIWGLDFIWWYLQFQRGFKNLWQLIFFRAILVARAYCGLCCEIVKLFDWMRKSVHRATFARVINVESSIFACTTAPNRCSVTQQLRDTPFSPSFTFILPKSILSLSYSFCFPSLLVLFLCYI